MVLTFNMLLRDAEIAPRDVRLLRHETRRHGRTPYSLWRDDPARFDDYQRVQKASRAGYFASPYWASFVVAPGRKTLFVGLARVEPIGSVPEGWVDPISGRDAASLSDYDLYALEHQAALRDYVGRLVIDWGAGAYAWKQRADRQDKAILELRERLVEPSFPGFADFMMQLSDLERIPPDWRGALSSVRGIYLLTCPRTKEQYVGAATGAEGFLGRWRNYADNGHGGNIALRSRDPEDYRVSILQVAGSSDTDADVTLMEVRWKAKLQSREMGLNRN